MKVNHNLIVGDTSQLSHYFPSDYKRISSRMISDDMFDNKFDSVYLTIGLSEKGLSSDKYLNVNVDYIIDLIKKFSPISNRVVVYSTCELWSGYDKGVIVSDPFNFKDDPYTLSKFKMVQSIKELKYDNVIIIYPFNFNTPHRSKTFLFGKIFHSIINKAKIEIGDININRDICRIEDVVRASIRASEDTLVGSGLLINVKKFVMDLYKHYDMEYDEYVTETLGSFNNKTHNQYYSEYKSSETYDKLLQSYIEMIENKLR